MATLNRPNIKKGVVYTINETVSLLGTNRESLRMWRKAKLIRETQFQVKTVKKNGVIDTRIQIGFAAEDIDTFFNQYAEVLNLGSK